MENNIKILAIDDIEDNLISLKALIRESFPESLVFTALNGTKGIEIATDIDPDVILLDIIMPDMDGFEVCEKLKADTYLKNVPVVFLTALKGDKENRIQALDCGGDAFLAKPIDQSELIAQIRAMVKIKKANDEQRDETERLKKMVDVQTRDLLSAHTVTKNLLYNLRKEYEIKAKAEKVLKQSEENYRNLVQHSPNLIYKYSSKEGLLFLSDRVKEVLGYNEADRIKNPFLWIDAINPYDKENFLQALQKNEKDILIEYQIKTKDGRWIWLDDTFMHKTQLGDETIIEGIATDITEKKKAEETLLTANERYRMIFDNTGTSNSIFDGDCRLILQNKESVRNLGLFSNEAIGKSVFDIFGDKGQAVYDRMQRVINSCKSETFDTEFNLTTGKKWFRSSYQPLIDELGVVIGVQIISQDITESKYVEMMQQLLNEIVTILNSNINIHEIVRSILKTIQLKTTISALGIRLKKGDDFPYLASLGFSNEFLSLENSLTVKTKRNDICRDKDGKPLLSCTCGMVLTGGNNNPNAPLTSTGSFWTNNSYPLLDLTQEQDVRMSPRNTCIHQKYGSVAIIPIRTADAIIGTLQLNDKRLDAFTPEMIAFFEGICLNIGNTLMRKQAEIALRESEQKLKAAMKIAKLASWEYSVETELFTFNDPFYHLLHTTVAEQGGYTMTAIKYAQQFVHPDYTYKVAEVISQSIETTDPNFFTKVECRLLCADAQPISVLVDIHVEKDEKGKTVKILAVTQDITERKENEVAVIESRDKFLKVFDHAPVMISISDFETGVFVDVNEYMLIVSGYDKTDIVGKKSTEINWISTDDRRILAKTVLKYGKVDGLELTYITKNGMVIYGLANAQKITINNRECLLTITTNITERKLAEKQLQKNNRALQLETLQKNAIINSTDDLIWSIDLNYNLLSANDAFLFSTKQFTGHRFQLGENLLDEKFYSPEMIAFWKDLYQKVMSGKIVQQEFYSPQTTTMPASWLDLSLNPIFHDLEFSGIACFGRNITDRKLTDQQILEAKERAEESEYFLRESQKVGDVGSYKTDFVKGTWISSEVLDKIFGIDEHYNRTVEGWLNIVYQEDKQEMNDYLLNDVIGRHVHFEKEYRIQRINDAEIRWVKGVGALLFDESGKLTEMIGTIQDITERRLAEEALKRSEAIQTKMVANIGDVIAIIDANGINTFKSPNISIHFGWEPSEVVGKGAFDLVHPDDVAETQAFFMSLLDVPNKTGTKELRYRCKNGEYKWILFTGVNLLHDPDIKGLLGNYHDISERKRILQETIEAKEHAEFNEQQIATERANILAIIENTADCIWAVNKEMKMTKANSALKDIMKRVYNIDYYDGMPWNETVVFVDNIEIDNFYLRALLGESASMILNIESNNKTLYFELFFNPIWTGEEITGVSCRSQNVTKRIEDEQILMRRTQELRLLIDSSNDYIFSVDSVFRIITCNNSFREAVNRLIGRKPSNNESILFPEFSTDIKARMLEIFDKVLEGESVHIEEQPGWHTKPHGFYSMVFNPINDLMGNVVGIVGVMRDITESKNMERQILNATIQAEERERNHFARELHEGLGPILSAIKLYFQWFNKADLKTPKEELINNIQSTINEAIATTKEISYKLSPHVLTNFGIVFAVNSFIEKLEKTNPITFTFNSNITERFQNEIEVTLYRVITESINNSIKYAQAKEISILLNHSGGIIELTYIDDGVGFDAEKTIKEAKGLGLFNMQNRIITLNGSFELRSRVGEGVFLHVTLPIE